MDNFAPLSAAVGGALIGLSAVLLMVFTRRIAGISGIFAGLINPQTTDRLWLAALIAGLIAALAITVGDLESQEVGNPSQGLRLAHTLCAECHLVDKLPGEQSPNLIAPSFEHVANTPGMNSAALTAALRTSHESMPNIIIKGSDLSDVIAYILSLTERR